MEVKINAEQCRISSYGEQNFNILHKSNVYKVDERVLKTMSARNIATNSPDTRLILIIYYESKKTSNLIMRNSKFKVNLNLAT